MKKHLSAMAAALGLVAAAVAGAAHAAGDMGLAQAHVKLAEQIAGTDLKRMLGNCNRLGSDYVIPKDKIHAVLKKAIGMGGLPPFKAFDNLYYVGTKWVASWAVKTSDGIILIDAQDNGDQVKKYVEPGLKALGMNPADIKKVIVTHSHGDHYGGAKYLQDTYGSEIIMSAAAWNVLGKRPLQYDDKLWDQPPKRGTSVMDGEQVKLGDTAVTVLATPGHTPDTISIVIPVKDGRNAHEAILWGGNGFNFGRNPALFVKYIKSTERVSDLAVAGIDVFMSNHNGLDGTQNHYEQLQNRKNGEQNPYVIGVDGVQRAMAVLRQCAFASLSSFSAESTRGLY